MRMAAALVRAGGLAALAAVGLSAAGAAPAGFAARFGDGPPPFAMPMAGSYALPPLRPAPEGEVIDENGRTHRLHDLLDGRITLVSFVYLLCGDVNGCPLALSTLFDTWHASAGVPELRGEVQLMTISFDPLRDTPEALASFAWPIRTDTEAARKIDWLLLTTRGPDEIGPLLEGFGQDVSRSNDPERLNHLLRMFLVDREGRIRNIYGLGMIDPRLIMTDVETLLAEEQGE